MEIVQVSLQLTLNKYLPFNPLTPSVSHMPTNCLSVFDHFVGLALKGLSKYDLLVDTRR